MKTCIGTKIVKLKPMTRAEYNVYRGWALPADEDGTDLGYLVEYTDGGKPNMPGTTAMYPGRQRSRPTQPIVKRAAYRSAWPWRR